MLCVVIIRVAVQSIDRLSVVMLDVFWLVVLAPHSRRSSQSIIALVSNSLKDQSYNKFLIYY